MNIVLTQAAAIASICLVSFYPTPEDFKDAWTRQLIPARLDPAPARPGENYEFTSSAYDDRQPTEIESQIAKDCLPDRPMTSLDQVDVCISKLRFAIIEQTQSRSVFSIRSPSTSRDLETARMALAKLCRLKWASANSYTKQTMPDECFSALSGIAE